MQVLLVLHINVLHYFFQHKRLVSDAQEKEPDVVFIGDSIMAYLSYTEMWDKQFAPMHAINFGIGAERVENVLWRVMNGEMEQMNPKVFRVSIDLFYLHVS